MPRNASGTYTLPNSAFVTNTVIASAAMNGNMNDIATALTQSIATTGVSTMTGPFVAFAGSVAAPGIAFSNIQTIGINQAAANQVGLAASSLQVVNFTSSGMTMGGTLIDRNGGTVYGMPLGLIIPYAGSSAPSLWLLCAGQAVSQATYALLFAAIGFTYGNPGGGNFSLPDLRGRAPFGKDNLNGTAANRLTTAGSGVDGTTLGANGGGQNVTILQANIPAGSATVNDPTHKHTITGSGISGGGGAFASGATRATLVTLATSSTGITVTLGGSSTALASINPALMLNYLIFAGA